MVNGQYLESGQIEYVDVFHERSYGMSTRMPNKGCVFHGKINDLYNYDAKDWRRRDISFIKKCIDCGESFQYPVAGDKIVLIDVDNRSHYLNVSKPDLNNWVCLGTPSRLKPWYEKEGFSKETVGLDRFVYFVYSGHGNEFLILTEEEYKGKSHA